MNINTGKINEYIEVLNEYCRQTNALCSTLEERLLLASQCLDSQSGRDAAMRIGASLEKIKLLLNPAAEASNKLLLVKHQVDTASSIMGRR